MSAKAVASDADAGPEPIITDAASTVDHLTEAKNVLIVPGYGLAVSSAQRAITELAQALKAGGARVRFGIHPVAGRMPGQLTVLLAEAGLDYEDVIEMEEANEG